MANSAENSASFDNGDKKGLQKIRLLVCLATSNAGLQ
jgi:hypothetical protein